jgi:hypothetical protein
MFIYVNGKKQTEPYVKHMYKLEIVIGDQINRITPFYGEIHRDGTLDDIIAGHPIGADGGDTKHPFAAERTRSVIVGFSINSSDDPFRPGAQSLAVIFKELDENGKVSGEGITQNYGNSDHKNEVPIIAPNGRFIVGLQGNHHKNLDQLGIITAASRK